MTPAFVLDANIALVWALGESESVGKTMAARDAIADAYALSPSIWSYEVTNAIIVKERMGRIPQDVAVRALMLLTDLPVRIRFFADADMFTQVVPLARRHQLTCYDAAYLAVAISEALPLATLDQNLIDAAGREGIAVFGA